MLTGRENDLNEGRRDKHDIVMQILSRLKSAKSIRRTRLMALVGLSSAQLKLYLGFLEENRLISTSGHEISLTETGLDHLDRCSCCPMFERSNAIWKFKMKNP
jgi:predicted transcriptional regulator